MTFPILDVRFEDFCLLPLKNCLEIGKGEKSALTIFAENAPQPQPQPPQDGQPPAGNPPTEGQGGGLDFTNPVVIGGVAGGGLLILGILIAALRGRGRAPPEESDSSDSDSDEE